MWTFRALVWHPRLHYNAIIHFPHRSSFIDRVLHDNIDIDVSLEEGGYIAEAIQEPSLLWSWYVSGPRHVKRRESRQYVLPYPIFR